jgi:choline dehydrogenase-like flavoprotein
MQILASSKVYDVCIVGSGAGGGMAAKVLTEAGAEVVMLEAGSLYDSAKDSAMFAWNYDSPRRGAGTIDRPFGEFDAAYGGWSLPGEPYTVAPGERWEWYRARMLGGRTNHWGRVSLRFGPIDFKGRSHDGLGDDWPISYDDIKPYYDKVDRLIGIFGTNEGFYNEPDGFFQPPPRARCQELFVKKGCHKLGIPCVPARMSVLTKPLNGRPACHYCAQCGNGCSTHSNFSSPSVLLPPALATGRLKIIPGAMVREVMTDENGLATGVSYVNTEDGSEHQVRARIVVLGASTCETARLLLNSKSSRFPSGLANSSGQVGRNLVDSIGSGVSGFFPQLMDGVPHNEDGIQLGHMYMPWWLDNKKLDFPRGYHIQFRGGRRMPGFGFMDGIHKYNGGGGYGAKLKEDYRRYYGAFIGFGCCGEMIPNPDSYCEIDPSVVDKWGIPVLRFHFKFSEYEYKQAKHMQETLRELITTLGGTPTSPMPTREQGYGISGYGRINHEVGTTRMGTDPKSSVLNEFCQAHESKNLFVVDGGPFVSEAHKNPTWTILALATRTSEYIADQRRKGNI